MVSRETYFRDGARKIDLVLVYKPQYTSFERTMFLSNLASEGLELEEEESSYKTTTSYIKVHAPREILLKYADIYEIPLKFQQAAHLPEPPVHTDYMKTILIEPHPNPHDPVCRRAKETVSKQSPKTFTTCERSSIVNSIMQHTKYGEYPFEVGLDQLIHKAVFSAAFPLHDGPYEWSDNEDEPLNDRQLLGKYWGSYDMWMKQQPLNIIEKYFGSEIALYFGWLGFYNKMLFCASVLGFVSWILGIINIYTEAIKEIENVCHSTKHICPYCRECASIPMSDYCSYFVYSYMADNSSCVIYSFIMAFWATIFRELWKRRHATLSLRWNLNTDTDIPLRPEFQMAAEGHRIHKYTGQPEQYIPMKARIKRYTCSVASVILMIIFLLGLLLSIIIYECILKMNEVEPILITMSSAMLTVLLMLLCRKIYGYIAVWLTRHEIPRTQLEFDNSYMIKMVLFSLVNNYGKLIYLAFLKGKFYTYPSDPPMRNELFPVAAEVCNPTGCVSELFIQLATITIFKPVFFSMLEYLKPKLLVWINRFKKKIPNSYEHLARWEKEYDLIEFDYFSIMDEFEEMVVQYGFITLFVASFPLAPLCALIKNIVEIRIDSSKMIKYYRRPLAKYSSSIGVWFDTLKAMTNIAVISNALFITMTSNFIPGLIYNFAQTEVTTGFIDFTLSKYQVVDSYWINTNITECWYVGYRNGPDHIKPYENSDMFYYIQYIRVVFALLFIVVVQHLTGILSYIIPDVPRPLKEWTAFNRKHKLTRQ
ncbi:uncharacterized protein CBL_12668 [Carabus blaptoides fortunei]